MENKRESNIELLRIVSMILIVAYHCTINSGYFMNNTFVALVLFITGMWGILGVDCFFIISFNFLYNSKFKIKKFINTITEIVFYSILLMIPMAVIVNMNTGKNISIILCETFIKGLKEPFWRDVYWFATIYLLMYLSFPILNKIVKELKEKELRYIVILLTGIILLYQMKETVIEDYFFCIYMYFAFFYIKKYKEFWVKQNCKIVFFICTVCLIFFKIISECHENNIFILNIISGRFGRHSILLFIDSVFLFYIFKTLKIKNSKIINAVASTTFGIYLFHENQIFTIRRYIYILSEERIFSKMELFSGYRFLLFYFLEILIIFILGMLIDFIRQWIKYKIEKCKKNNGKIYMLN